MFFARKPDKISWVIDAYLVTLLVHKLYCINIAVTCVIVCRFDSLDWLIHIEVDFPFVTEMSSLSFEDLWRIAMSQVNSYRSNPNCLSRQFKLQWFKPDIVRHLRKRFLARPLKVYFIRGCLTAPEWKLSETELWLHFNHMSTSLHVEYRGQLQILLFNKRSDLSLNIISLLLRGLDLLGPVHLVFSQ